MYTDITEHLTFNFMGLDWRVLAWNSHQSWSYSVHEGHNKYVGADAGISLPRMGWRSVSESPLGPVLLVLQLTSKERGERGGFFDWAVVLTSQKPGVWQFFCPPSPLFKLFMALCIARRAQVRYSYVWVDYNYEVTTGNTLGALFNYFDNNLPIIDHLSTYPFLLTYFFKYCFKVKSLYAVTISSTTYLPCLST